jgi:chorismate-pyruvate lyase
MRTEKDKKALNQDIENKIKQLPKILQIILNTEGTVTEILSQWIGENVKVEKLKEKNETTYKISDSNVYYFDADKLLDERTVLVRNNKNNLPLVMAVSAVYLEYLPDALKHKLHGTDTGVGKLLRVEKIPTHREIEKIEFLPISDVPNFSAYFPEEKNAVLHRIYNIYMGMERTKKILTINEYWPASIQL